MSHTEAAEILEVMAGAARFNRWMADTISPWLAGDVLELGAGIGNLTKLLAPRARSYRATDIDETYLQALHELAETLPNVTVSRCDVLRPGDFASLHGQIGVIVCLNMLEHIGDDTVALRNMFEALMLDGILVLLVPQGPEIFGSLDEAVEHKRRYSRMQLNSKLSKAGFHMERMLAFNRISYPGWYLNGRVLERRSFSTLQVKFVDMLVPLWRRLDRFLPWPPTSLIAVCRKPKA